MKRKLEIKTNQNFKCTNNALKEPYKNDTSLSSSLKNENQKKTRIIPSEWFKHAKNIFQRSSIPTSSSLSLYREKEWSVIDRFWEEHVERRIYHFSNYKPPHLSKLDKSKKDPISDMGEAIPLTNGALYISGSPGTGKTALISAFIESKDPLPSNVKLLQMNCMTMNDPKKLSKYIHQQFVRASPSHKQNINDDRTYLDDLQDIFIPKSKTLKKSVYLLIMDEIDQLLPNINKDKFEEQILCKLFEWSQEKNSRLIFIGISNAIDLIHEWRPNFKLKNIRDPLQCHFVPYSVQAMLGILNEKLSFKEHNHGAQTSKMTMSNEKTHHYSGFHPLAIELCARKVASMGDLRKVIDLCRLAIEAAENDYYESLCNDSGGIDHQNTSDNKENVPSTHYLVNVNHVQKSIASVFGSAAVQLVLDLNLHHKLALLSLLLLKKEKLEANIDHILSKYLVLCQDSKLEIAAMTRVEFQDSLTFIEGKGLLSTQSITKKHNLKKLGFFKADSIFTLKISESDLIHALETIPFLCDFVKKENI